MKPENIQLVKQSWFLITQMDKKVLGKLFYNRLFKIEPELKPLFKKIPVTVQCEKLLNMLSYIISNLDCLENITKEIEVLAKRYVRYGVKNKHYEAAGKALLWSLKQGFGKYWGDDFTIAWTAVYEVLATTMINEAQD